MRQRSRKFAIPNTEANRDLIEFLWRGPYNVMTDGPSMSDRPDTYFTFTVSQSGHVANKRDVSAAKLYDRNEYGEHVPLAIVHAQP